MVKKLTLQNLDDLAIGSAILGSGGGGDSTYAYMMARYEMEKKASLSILNYADLKPEALVIPIGFMGAPTVEMEKIVTGRDYVELFKIVEKNLNKKITAIMPFEIGGHNAFTPIITGLQMGLPVLDADMMGRAFPEAQMSSGHLYGVSPNPGFISDSLDNAVVIHAKNTFALEKIGRSATIAMGSIAAFAFYPITGAKARECTVPNSISRAINLGKAHRSAKEKGEDPLEAILNHCKGILIGSGKITDIDREISKGFLQGSITIQNSKDKIELIFQNEYLLAKINSKIIATTPDILMLLEQETGAPITSELLQYGLRVNLIALPAPEIWTTPQGLALVGPRKFGYETDYKPIHKARQKSSVLSITT
ncbi:hypothetical protein DB42_BD00150 [Neochlamydia sp. EPS4]|nr:hypothetical protein DB42_BD00150 [Neochlamydia sp. EPS4]